MTLQEAIQARSARPRPDHYNPSVVYIDRGDYLAIHFADKDYFAERVDEVLTVYRAFDDGQLVGCKLKGVSLLARNVSSMIAIEEGGLSVNLLLLNAAGRKPPSEYYYEVCERAARLRLTVPEQLLQADRTFHGQPPHSAQKTNLSTAF
ncbi:MAG: hypothetical protein RIK87_17380 [Fuerstiella sp.]